MMRKIALAASCAALCSALLLLVLASDAAAQAQTQTQSQPQNLPPSPQAKPSGKAPEPSKRVIEEIVARVNNEIITRSDLVRARESLRRELEDDCREASQANPASCTPEKLQKGMEEREKDVLRDLVDNSLLVQRGKDLGLNVEPSVVKQLDAVRVQNNLPDMEALERAVSQAGVVWEEYKSNIRNRLLTQEVIRREVGPSIEKDISKEEMRKFYDEHKDEFYRPEQVVLSEIFVSTEGKSEAEIPALEQKAKTLLDRVKKGEDFNELAKRYSDGSTAKQGGDLGVFRRGQVAKELEEQVFKMKRGDLTEVIRTRTGFLTLKVEQRYEEGLQPIEKVENEIMNQLYFQKMQPALRAYLTRLREESYVLIKPGFTDTVGVSSAPIRESQPVPEDAKGKKKAKKEKKGPAGSL
jgi:peptidyl-prolyl cis-trans isomerase SurA